MLSPFPRSCLGAVLTATVIAWSSVAFAKTENCVRPNRSVSLGGDGKPVGFEFTLSGRRYRADLEPWPSLDSSRGYFDVSIATTARPRRNLLESHYHGLQAYDLPARGFVNGPAGSIGGAQRTARSDDRRLTVQFTILKANVTPIKSTQREQDYDFTELVVGIDKVCRRG